MLSKYIYSYKNEIIQKTCELIKIPSVYRFSDNPLFPFGKKVNNALEYMLSLGKALGFKTKNLNGYCGYIEFGKGVDLIGIIGHLDVVPEGDNWTYPPFSATIFDNKIYGRGAIDDKGPVISSLYAMKVIKDNYKINKRVRLILGLNEENDWKCINYYKKHEELPSIGFSPDADFPCIFCEKSILSFSISMDYSEYLQKDIVLKYIDCNNNPINVVPKICSTILKVNPNKIFMCDFISITKKIIDKYNFEIDIYQLNNNEVKLTSHGISAHAAHPDLGINSISMLLILLNNIFENYNIHISLFDFFYKYINNQYNGESLGVNTTSETGNTTLNVGNIDFKDNFLKININLRIPIDSNIDKIQNHIKNLINHYPNMFFETIKYIPGIYYPKNDYLVRTLCDIYNNETNSNLEPIAIGGATFARAFNNCISFGANFPGDKDMCHQTDEFIDIDKLILSCKMYAKAILKL